MPRKLIEEMFDVKPMVVTIRFRLTSDVGKADYSGTVTIRNAVSFTFADSQTGAEVRVECRIDPDKGTLPCRLWMRLGEGRFEKILHPKSGESVVFKMREMVAVKDAGQQLLKTKISENCRWFR